MSKRNQNADPLNVVGRPYRKVDARAKCVGQTKFADDIVLPYRQLGLTTVDEGLDLAEQAYPGRPVPARFGSCLPRWTLQQ